MISIGKPTILAIDSASNACSAALLIDGDVRRHEWEGMIRGHAKVLMPMISSVVGDYGYHNIDAIAVTIGPGAYTGIRIGLATARGLALASELPIIGVSNFKAVARGVSQKITDKYYPRRGGDINRFLIEWGLNMAGNPPSGNVFQTAA